MLPRNRGSLWRRLRSRRVAVYLLLLVTLYAWLATLIPLGDARDADVVKWAAAHPTLERVVGPLGMHQPYTTPWFLVVALWLTLSTGACTVERSVRALRAYRTRSAANEHDSDRLSLNPTVVLSAPDPGVDGEKPSAVLEAAASGLRAKRMKVAQQGETLIAVSRSVGLLGSPLFHAALTALFVLGFLGWMTRAEGGINLLLNKPVIEGADAYAPGASAGPLFMAGGYSGYELTALEQVPNLRVGGVDRGSAARIRVRDGERIIAQHLVYPNRPMRFGDIMIHHKDVWGPGIDATVWSSQTSQTVDLPLLLEFDSRSMYGIRPLETSLSLGEQASVQLHIRPEPKSRVAVTVRSADESATKVVKQGESVSLTGPYSLRINRLTEWTQITVVHDWSVPWLYACFALGTLGMVVAVLLPSRRVLARVYTDENGTARLHLCVKTARSDPAFGLRVIEQLRHDGFERQNNAG